MRISLRRLLCISMVLFSIACPIGAEETPAEVPLGSEQLAAMDIADLLTLRAFIDEQLVIKGYVEYFDLERNDQGPAVFNIQNRLHELGFYLGNNSGKFDSETQRAFKLFEKANNLKNDGVASREDQMVLFGQNALTKDSQPVGDTSGAAGTTSPAGEETISASPSPKLADFGLEMETSWSANVGMNGVILYTPYIKATVKNQRGNAASRITIDVVFYDETDKIVWDDETYYLVGSGDSALRDGYSKTAFIKSSVGYKSKILASNLPDITAEVSINGTLYETVAVNKVYE